VKNRIGSMGLVVLGAFGLAGCQSLPTSGNGSAEVSLIITQVPVGRTPAGEAWLPPDERYPAGSRVILVRAGDAATEVRVLSRGLWAAGAPAVSFDGRRAVFAGKAASGGRWSIYQVALRGTHAHKLADAGRDCTDPAYLPDHRVVFTCADADDTRGSWSLHVIGDKGRPQRITFAPGRAVTPTVLADGRVLFSFSPHWDETTVQGAGFSLFTINPDGTLLDPFTDSHPPAPAELRPRLTSDGGVLFVSVAPETMLRQVGRTELAYPRSRASILRLPVATAAELHPGTVEPHPQGGLLVTAPSGRSATASWGVFHEPSGEGQAQSLLDTAPWDEIEAVAVVASSPPRRRPSSLDPERATGQVVCYDAALSDHTLPALEGGRRPARLHVQAHDATDGQPLVDAPIHDDGSFLLELPADRALRIRTFDAQGQAIATSGWFWLRPGEVRACFGCHEDRRSAPRNHPIQALAGQTPAPEAGP